MTGQGGCLTTNDDELANRIRKLKDFGRISGGIDIHDEFGINSKFTEFQAIVGLDQLKNINWRIKRKKKIYNIYYNYLKHIDDIEFLETDLNITTPWFIDIYIEKRKELSEFLINNNIKTRNIYPSIPSQKCYNIDFNFPTTERYSSRGLWLPSSLTLKDDEIKYICNKIKEFYEK